MLEAAERYRRYLETLTPVTLANLDQHVSSDVRFKDPFNECQGVEEMRVVFAHMFESVSDIQFKVHLIATHTDFCLMDWTFDGILSGRPWRFDGASVIAFDKDGLVASHIDYWDAASALYERFPIIGPLLAFLRRRIGTH